MVARWQAARELTRTRAPFNALTMRLGVCYYPEHWPEEWWADDAARMVAMGLSRVRIGEFAWSRIEPEPGRFDWGWLDRAIAVTIRAHSARQPRCEKQ